MPSQYIKLVGLFELRSGTARRNAEGKPTYRESIVPKRCLISPEKITRYGLRVSRQLRKSVLTVGALMECDTSADHKSPAERRGT